MPEINLTQAEAGILIAMEKIRADDESHRFPGPGDRLTIPLTSLDKREAFLLDISRAQINLAKVTYQNRARQVVVLIRLDLGGPSHQNPDGEVIACPHLHIYREGFADKWAIPILPEAFRDTTNLNQSFEDFMTYCNITERPVMQTGLF